MDRARRVMKLIFASLIPISYVELTICNGYNGPTRLRTSNVAIILDLMTVRSG